MTFPQYYVIMNYKINKGENIMNAILKGHFLFNFGNNEISVEEVNETIKQIFKIIGTEKDFNEKDYPEKKISKKVEVNFDIFERETTEEALK